MLTLLSCWCQLHVSEARVEHTLSKLTDMEDKLMETLPPQQRSQTQTQEPPRAQPGIAEEVQHEVRAWKSLEDHGV